MAELELGPTAYVSKLPFILLCTLDLSLKPSLGEDDITLPRSNGSPHLQGDLYFYVPVTRVTLLGFPAALFKEVDEGCDAHFLCDKIEVQRGYLPGPTLHS